MRWKKKWSQCLSRISESPPVQEELTLYKMPNHSLLTCPCRSSCFQSQVVGLYWKPAQTFLNMVSKHIYTKAPLWGLRFLPLSRLSLCLDCNSKYSKRHRKSDGKRWHILVVRRCRAIRRCLVKHL